MLAVSLECGAPTDKNVSGIRALNSSATQHIRKHLSKFADSTEQSERELSVADGNKVSIKGVRTIVERLALHNGYKV